MDEIRSAYGLLNLKQVDQAIGSRKAVAEAYREGLKDVKGIRCMQDLVGVRHNYAYFPIFVDEKEYGMSRDDLYFMLKANQVLGRRYFYPLISEFPIYRGLPSAKKENLPVANAMADAVICLPIYHDLKSESVKRVIEIIREQQCLS